ncbi:MULTISPECIES: FecCD family ABC transporter permease [Catenuloplanes]|uniref:Iron complex transport system permease protein n=1 Tax=Catenuloplanes niger TaxID=587534 RepID=A0AAE3ZW78_9ACTN|nr:iron chelate uptake ABC transporter family permease subunit [Catenuloplanes niger]MDR7327022.1 iron complex transport system permease protein [Catenuloplanes niger]
MTTALRQTRAEITRVRRSGSIRTVVVSSVLAAVAAVLFCLALSTGAFQIPIAGVLDTLLGQGTRRDTFVIMDVRLPRVLVALLAGAAFGLSGALFQSLVHNPLASPDVIGVTMGASAAAVTCTVVLGVVGAAVSAGAFAGALATAALIYLLAWRRGVSGYRLVLVGIGVGAVLSSIVSYLMSRADVTSAQQALVWLTGSLNARSYEHVWPLLTGVAVLLPAALLLARGLRVLGFGDETARGLGARVETLRLSILVTGVALAAFATAAAGPVPFVAFVAGPIARRLVGERTLALIPAALVGAVVMVASDLVAQRLLGDRALPVGVVTGAVGAPFLLWQLASANREGRGG